MPETKGSNIVSLKELKKARKKRREADKDKFAEGAVIRWKVVRDERSFTFAAIKTGHPTFPWYTTSQFDNSIPKRATFEQLLDVLSRDRVVDVEVASDWLAVDDA